MKTLALDLLSRSRITLLWWIAGTAAMGAYVVGVYDSIGNLEELRKLYEGYPESIRNLVGDVDISTLNGWLQVELLSWVPLILAIYAGIFAASHISRETEQRTIDFVLGLPVSRREFLISRIAVGAANMATICLAIFVLLMIEVPLVGHDPSPGRYALALSNAFLVGAALFAAYVLIASFTDDQGRVTGITLGVTLLLYVAKGALQAANAPDVILWLTPFEHYHAAEAMAGRAVPLLPLIILPLIAVFEAAAAIYWFSRRDIAT
jgi:ABC-type transport system involved in multi-copper enzyme maturation permease subunit